MRLVGADPARLLHRLPLALQYPDGQGLVLRPGAPMPAFVRAVLGRTGWTLERTAGAAGRGRALGGDAAFAATDGLSVAELCRRLPASGAAAADRTAVRGGPEHAGRAGQCRGVPACAARCAVQRPRLVGPAAARRAAGRAAAAAGRAPGSSARACACTPARAWRELQPDGAAWRLDGQRFDAVVLACSAAEAARLAATFAPDWARQAAALRYEPIVTVYLQCAGARLPLPMLALHADDYGTGAVRLRPGRAGRRGRRVRLRRQRRARLGRSRPGGHRRRPRWRRRWRPSRPAPGRRCRPCCTWPPRSAPPSAARPACSARRRPSRRGCGPPATMSPAPTRPRWKARCARAATRPWH